jgi:hypothetical protein
LPRLEAIVGGICLGAWTLATIFLAIGNRGLDRFAAIRLFFPFAATLGWFAGNIYVARRRRKAMSRRALLAIYLGGPPGLIWLFWTTLPTTLRVASPIAPPLALGIYGIFFLVPVTLRRRA